MHTLHCILLIFYVVDKHKVVNNWEVEGNGYTIVIFMLILKLPRQKDNYPSETIVAANQSGKSYTVIFKDLQSYHS